MKEALRSWPRQLGVVGLVPALSGGMIDAGNPGSFAGVALFFVFLVVVACKDGRILTRGSLFICGLLLMRVFCVLGILDFIILAKWFDTLLDVWYFILAAGCFWIGTVFWHDWWMDLRVPRGRQKWPAEALTVILEKKKQACAGGRQKGSLKRGLFWDLAALAAGAFTALTQTAWAPDASFLIMLYALLGNNQLVSSGVMAFFYSLVYIYPLAGTLVLVKVLLHSEKVVDNISRRFSMAQLVLSAFFLGVGISFLSYYTIF